MSEETKAKHRFELIKIAREILNEEYLNKRAEDHNKWLAENDLAKLHKRLRVPYPPFVQFPTEDIILEKARALYAFVYDEKEDDVIKSFPAPVQVDEKVVEEAVEEIVEEVIEEIPPLMSDDSKHESHGFLPGWIRRPR